MAIVKKALVALAVAGTIPLAVAGTAYADIPFNQPVNGNATYYDSVGYGACGTQINAGTDYLVAVSPSYWTSANPNNDPLCSGVSVQVSYNGQTVTVPVKDQCPGCDASHIDLGKPVFTQLTGGTDLGNIPVTWQFVHS
ncbi:cysteine/serine endopeptidase inhibitor [Kutzneria sp. CA-103260]|uniref:cysteine/serine endopeptidase inhibitor n=1 Tax=Kutzneria sp. CA-103260 TaxID=2802641 RepID=UPI001BA61FF6|nr:cysteine/serine endopeptidase inhibitor [Kutzneria sp. CA-103260]QUQ67234.1 rare lipoprotein A [Kutzneria sp. CA-103260]